MTHAPQITVLLPVFNGAAHLPAALDSLLGQTFSDFEVLVIDDGSKDATSDILSEYARADSRLRIIRHESNEGLIASLNEGLREARAPLVARQDADDVSLPTRLEHQHTAFAHSPKLGILGSAYYRIKPDGERVLRVPPLQHTEIRWRLLFDNVWCHSTIMLRQAAVRDDEFGPFLHAEDFELWGRLLRKTRGATLPDPLVNYFEHDDAVSARHAASQRDMVAHVSRLRLQEVLDSEVSLAQAAEMRDCWRGRLEGVDLRRGVRNLLAVFEHFGRLPDSDPRVVRGLRYQWIRRLLQSADALRLSSADDRAALGVLARQAPISTAVGLILRRRPTGQRPS